MKFLIVFAAVIVVVLANKDDQTVRFDIDNIGPEGYKFAWVLFFRSSKRSTLNGLRPNESDMRPVVESHTKRQALSTILALRTKLSQSRDHTHSLLMTDKPTPLTLSPMRMVTNPKVPIYQKPSKCSSSLCLFLPSPTFKTKLYHDKKEANKCDPFY